MSTEIDNQTPADYERETATAAHAKAYQTRAFMLLSEFVNKRPGLDPRDYGSSYYYNQDRRQITRSLNDFHALRRAIEWRQFNPADIREAFRSAYSGRLSIIDGPDGMPEKLVFCAGQYPPTEYRNAACAVLGSLHWLSVRVGFPKLDGHGIRAHLRRQFGRGIASRWFS